MQTSLPLVSDLHHPAMRPRHFKQLMKVCIFSTFMTPLSCMLKLERQLG